MKSETAAVEQENWRNLHLFVQILTHGNCSQVFLSLSVLSGMSLHDPSLVKMSLQVSRNWMEPHEQLHAGTTDVAVISIGDWCTFSIFRGLLFITTSSWTLHFFLFCWVWGTGLLILRGFAPPAGLSLLLLGGNMQTLIQTAHGTKIFKCKTKKSVRITPHLLPALTDFILCCCRISSSFCLFL